MVIYLNLLSPISFSDIFKEPNEQLQTVLFNLASGGVYRDTCCYQQIGELLPRLSTFNYKKLIVVYFCCTILKVAFTGISPAPCSMKLGLSSPQTITLGLRPSGYLTTVNHFIFFIKLCQVKVKIEH